MNFNFENHYIKMIEYPRRNRDKQAGVHFVSYRHLMKPISKSFAFY